MRYLGRWASLPEVRRILDAGCGDGETLARMTNAQGASGVGIDASPGMLGLARSAFARPGLDFLERDLQAPLDDLGLFDLVYTERALINLGDWPSQRTTIMSLAERVANGGWLVLVENCEDGLRELNALRAQFGLAAIQSPTHNCYLPESEMNDLEIHGMTREGVDYYSDTYYFLSRVVQARLASAEGREPTYDHVINQMALNLPDHLVDLHCGQGRAWVYRRRPVRGKDLTSTDEPTR
jgi:SAM-dependent methyltransferase